LKEDATVVYVTRLKRQLTVAGSKTQEALLKARQGTKRRQAQVDAEDLVQAQILGEIAAIQLVEPVLGRGKRVRISRKQ